MNTSDQMDFSSINSSINYKFYWQRCQGENLTTDASDITEILALPSFQLAFTISKVLIIACFCMTFIVGVLGNSLVIWIAGFRMKTVSAVWFVNLAIVDFMFCISLPTRVVIRLLSQPNEEIFYLVVLNFILLHMNSIVSVLFLTVISIDRCVTIMWPIWAKVHRTRRFAIICSVFLWTVPFFITILSMTFLDLDVHIFYIHVPFYDHLSHFCQFKNSPFEQYLMFTRSFIMFGLAFTIILVCYGLIIFRLRSSTFKRPRKFRKTFRIIIAVVVCFFCCWFPYNMWPFVAKNETLHQVLANFIISSLCLSLVGISSCLNPVLYVFLGKGSSSNWRKSIRSKLENTMNELK